MELKNSPLSDGFEHINIEDKNLKRLLLRVVWGPCVIRLKEN